MGSRRLIFNGLTTTEAEYIKQETYERGLHSTLSRLARQTDKSPEVHEIVKRDGEEEGGLRQRVSTYSR